MPKLSAVLTVFGLLFSIYSNAQKVVPGPTRNGPSGTTPDGHKYHNVYDRNGKYISTRVNDYNGHGFGGYKARNFGYGSQPTGRQVDLTIRNGYKGGHFTQGIGIGGGSCKKSDGTPDPDCKIVNKHKQSN